MGAAVGGGKKGKFDLGQNSDINVTPFVDVMLVLLIIFMVAAPLPTVSIKVEIPPPLPNQAPPPHKPVFITVQKGEKLNISGVPTTIPTLVADLEKAMIESNPAAAANPIGERVMIRADRDVRYAEFMDVLNTLQGVGFTKIGLIAEDL
jgi:biopolymer transport protein ExbD